MNFININITKRALLLACTMFLVFSCVDEDKAPIVTFDTAGHGAYPRLISEIGERNVDLFDIAGSRYEYTIEFVDELKGDMVSEYFLELKYVDINGVNSTGPIEYKKWSASEFETNADGFKGLSGIAILATEMISALGLTEAQINSADIFRLTGTIVMINGDVFTGANASSTVKGSSFRGHFDFSLPAVCPSNLAGTHTYSTIPWCDATVTVTGTTTWVTESLGVYSIDGGDYAFGAYFPCYGPTATLPGGSLRIVDLCNMLSWAGASRWAEIYTFNSVTVNGADLILDWVNDYGEAGISTITREGGADWPPLTKF